MKGLTVFALFARDNLKKLLGLIALMMILQTGIFCIFGLNSVFYLLEEKMDYIKIPVYIIVILGFVVYYEIIGKTLVSKKCASKYTIKRLLISEKHYYLLSCLYGIIMIFIFYAAEVLTILLIMRINSAFMLSNPDLAAFFGPQNNLMALYRVPIFHNFIPINHLERIIGNIAIIIFSGIIAGSENTTAILDNQPRVTIFIPLIFGATFTFNYNTGSYGAYGSEYSLRDFIIIFAIFAASIILISTTISNINNKNEKDKNTEQIPEVGNV